MSGWLSKLFRKEEARILMVGLDASGRTTILYKLKLGEIVTTIPTIGFNVETLVHKNTNLTVWDVGGCDKIRPLWRHYYQNTQVLIFVIDSNDRERISEASEELQRMLREDELRNTILLVFANKQDLEKTMSADEITDKLGLHSLTDRKWYIQPCCATSGDGLYEGFDWITDTLFTTKPTKRISLFSNKKRESTVEDEAFKIPTDEELLEVIRNGTDEPSDSILFLESFKAGKIHRFDHRSHLRVGFLVLYHDMKKGMKPSAAVDHFTDTLRQFFKNADPRQIRQTFHISMTIFWCHAINLALTAFVTSEEYDESLPDEILFTQFLEMFPTLMWSGLWTKHYTKDTLMSPEARSKFVLPDLQPFPAYMTLQSAIHSNTSADGGSNEEFSDDLFVEKYEARLLSIFDENDLARLCFIKLQRMGDQRRAQMVNTLMETLQQTLMRLRAAGGTKLQFSQTHTYFWIQIMNAALASLQFQEETSIEDLTFHDFTLLFPELLPENCPWKTYYTEDCFNSMESRRTFSAPDRKGLPNVFSKRSVDNSFLERNGPRVPLSLLKTLSKDVVQILAEKKSDTWRKGMKGYQMTDQLLLKSFHNGLLDSISHIDMIRMMYIHITLGWEKGERGTVAVTRIVDDFETYWKKQDNSNSSVTTEETFDWKSESIQQISKNIFANRFNQQYSGITHLHFWIQMVSASLTKATYFHHKALQDFGEFLLAFPELLWDKFWFIYYSPNCCFSEEAKAMVLPADKSPLPAFIKTKNKN